MTGCSSVGITVDASDSIAVMLHMATGIHISATRRKRAIHTYMRVAGHVPNTNDTLRASALMAVTRLA